MNALMRPILLLIFFQSPQLLFAQNTAPFIQPCHDGYTYAPDKNTKPVVAYADMDGDKKDEAIVAMQMYSTDGNDYPRSFAYVYKTDKDGNPKDMLQTISLNELLGVSIDAKNKNIIEVIDLNNDGKKQVAIWTIGGLHYHSVVIVGMRDGKIATLFNNGSSGQVEYEQNKNTIRIERINLNDPECAWNNMKFLLEVWEWNGKEFEYNNGKSTSPLVSENEENNKMFQWVSKVDFSNTNYDWIEDEKKSEDWEYKFKRMNMGLGNDPILKN